MYFDDLHTRVGMRVGKKNEALLYCDMETQNKNLRKSKT